MRLSDQSPYLMDISAGLMAGYVDNGAVMLRLRIFEQVQVPGTSNSYWASVYEAVTLRLTSSDNAAQDALIATSSVVCQFAAELDRARLRARLGNR